MRITHFVRYSLFAAVLALSASAFAGVVVQVAIAPPALPVYTQPPCPGDGYIWTPGYWAYGPDGYYWVPGTWALAPEPGLLWTPGYWGWGAGVYIWHPGYWGPHVGFYGGINYGFGYTGVGFFGGYWDRGHFFYNRSVNNIRITNVHVYNRVVVNDVHVTRVSYNGGHGGMMAQPTREQERFDHERHFEPTRVQFEHENGARGNREFLASVNHGRPAIAATVRPAEFHGREAAASRGGARPMPRTENHAARNVPHPQGNGREFNRGNMQRGNERAMNRPMPRDENRGMHAAPQNHSSGQPKPHADERHGNSPRAERQGHGRG